MKDRQIVKCTEISYNFSSTINYISPKFVLIRLLEKPATPEVGNRMINNSVFVEMTEQEYEIFQEQFDHESN